MKQLNKKGKRNQIGSYGEEIACKYLKNKGYTILEQNYLKKWGEIDIVARETAESVPNIHFVEVKTVSYETIVELKKSVSRGTYRPEENVHPKKLERLHRTIESWFIEKKYEGNWQIDVLAVRIVPREKFATVKMIENIVS